MHLKSITGGSARVAMLIGVLLSIIPTALAGWRLAHRDEGRTAAHRIVWLDASGQTIPRDRFGYEQWRCIGLGDFDMFVDGARAWVHCRAGDLNTGDRIGRIDLENLGARLAWPLAAGATGADVAGLLPLDDGVAFVLRGTTKARADVLTVAIPGHDGWELPPIELPGGQQLLGIAMNDGAIELVAHTSDWDQPAREPILWRVPITGEPVPRGIDPDALGCEQRCEIAAAYLHEGERRWRFIVERSRFAHDRLVDVAEDGTHRVIDHVDSSAFPFGDRVATGVLHQSQFMRSAWRLWPDGRIGPPPDGARTYYQRDADARLERVHSWFDGARRIHEVDGRIVVVTPILADGSEATEDTHWDKYEYVAVADGTGPAAIVARVRDCHQLASGLMLRRGDGYRLIHTAGCYVELDASLRRSDGRDVLDHLRMRGSMYTTWDEQSHAWKLGFVLFGLPLILALALAVANDRSRTRALVIGPWLHAALATWWLRDLWELLR